MIAYWEILPAVEAVDFGDGDVDAVARGETEEPLTELLDHVGMYVFAVDGKVVKEFFGRSLVNQVLVVSCKRGLAGLDRKYQILWRNRGYGRKRLRDVLRYFFKSKSSKVRDGDDVYTLFRHLFLNFK